MRRPATLYLWLTPTTLEWALWAVPKASLTKTFPSLVSFSLKVLMASGLLLIFFPSLSLTDPSYSGWYLTFSHKKMPPSELLTAASTESPTQSSKKVTGLSKYAWRGPRTGFRECLGFLSPLGLPRWESNTKDLGLNLSNSWMVGMVPMWLTGYFRFCWHPWQLRPWGGHWNQPS